MAGASITKILEELDGFCSLIDGRIATIDELKAKREALERGLDEVVRLAKTGKYKTDALVSGDIAEQLVEVKEKLDIAIYRLHDAANLADEYADHFKFEQTSLKSSISSALGLKKNAGILHPLKSHEAAQKAVNDAKDLYEQKKNDFDFSGKPEDHDALINATHDLELAQANLESWRNRRATVIAARDLLIPGIVLGALAAAHTIPLFSALSIGKALYDVAKPIKEAYLRAKEQSEEGASLVKATWDNLKHAQFGEGGWDDVAKGAIDLAGSIAEAAIPGSKYIIRAFQAGGKALISQMNFLSTIGSLEQEESGSLDESNRKKRARQEKVLAGNDFVKELIGFGAALVPFIDEGALIMKPFIPIAEFCATARSEIPLLDFYCALKESDIGAFAFDSIGSIVLKTSARVWLAHHTATADGMREIERKKENLQGYIQKARDKLAKESKRHGIDDRAP